jgi:hypothetical protein
LITTHRAWYYARAAELLGSSPDEVLGTLAGKSSFDIDATQRDAWVVQLGILRDLLPGLDGHVALEFTVPRLGSRIDTVLLFPRTIVVLEFKVGATHFHKSAIDQAWDYALDLKNFHSASHKLTIVPILVATEARQTGSNAFNRAADDVFAPICARPIDLRDTIEHTLNYAFGEPVDVDNWINAPYRPTPTIVEAARSLYSEHSVEAIARSDADAKNLAQTSRRVETLIDEARSQKKKIVCFVTGVPGAGKTLVGLNIATRRHQPSDPAHAVFLSGNGPLVSVLREALISDEVAREKARGKKVRRGDVKEKVQAFIQNIHHFRDAALEDAAPPADHVVVFDEGQRAWNLSKTADFMKRKKGRPGFSQSEPEFLLSYMDRHREWAAVVCLVGGGQEINTGEAGIGAWVEAIKSAFPSWEMHISDRLADPEYDAGGALEGVKDRAGTFLDETLHLSTSMRSFRAERVSAFVKALLDCSADDARGICAKVLTTYPIVVTRDLSVAREWLRAKARGTERTGIVASSKALRLKPHALNVRATIDPRHWFLKASDDVRSSVYLEDVATEFQVQGLELDWACVAWDGDLRHSGDCWQYRDFRGRKWTKVNHEHNRRYLLNAYRVLLTRARQGMVLFVPRGDGADHTRQPEFYDHTFEYLCDLGVPAL